MMDPLNKYGLLNSLTEILNENDESSMNTTIARYLLERYRNLDSLNIYQMADGCFTSRATIRRFMKNIGFENFSDFKTQAAEVPYTQYLFGEREDTSAYAIRHAKELYQMATECNNLLIPNLSNIVNMLHNAHQVTFLTSDMYVRQVFDFQREMIIGGKLIRIVTNKFEENSTLANQNNNDLTFVISISGYFATKAQEMMRHVAGNKILLTGSRSENFDQYDFIQYVSNNDIQQHRSIYHDFAPAYVLNVIQHEYLNVFSK